MTSKLTEKELEVLALLVNGAGPLRRCVHLRGNRPESYFLSRGMKTVRATSVRKLLSLGLVEDKELPAWRWRGSHYEITAAGRAMVDSALKAQCQK